jgi:acyl carrier protein
MTLNNASVRSAVRNFLTTNFVLDPVWSFDDACSLLDAGILDSTGVMELVAFLQNEYSIDVRDEDVVVDNLDSVDRICCFVAQRAEWSVHP